MKAHLFIAGLLVCAPGISHGPARRGSGSGESVFWQLSGGRGWRTALQRACARVMCCGSGGETRPAIVSGERVEIWGFRRADVQHHQNGVADTPMTPQRLRNPTSGKSSPTSTRFAARRSTARSGDVARGEAGVLGHRQCGDCQHGAAGRGGLTAPDLSNIAGVRKSSSIVDCADEGAASCLLAAVARICGALPGHGLLFTGAHHNRDRSDRWRAPERRMDIRSRMIGNDGSWHVSTGRNCAA